MSGNIPIYVPTTLDLLREITIVLVGATGSGKSATGNSILGRKAFQSMPSFGPVTNVCMLQSTVLKDGRTLNVIDTPGLFDSFTKRENMEKEIVRCVDMARDGIQAFIMVVSLKVRFTRETIVETLNRLFGAKVADYVTVVFTGGDELDDDESLDDYLARTCPNPLKELLEMCGNRRVVFDNKTTDKGKKAAQLQQLLTVISSTVVKNGLKPYTPELFAQFKAKEAAEMKQKMNNNDQIPQPAVPAGQNEVTKMDSKTSEQPKIKPGNEEPVQHRIAATEQYQTRTIDSKIPEQQKQIQYNNEQTQQRIVEMKEAANMNTKIPEQQKQKPYKEEQIQEQISSTDNGVAKKQKSYNEEQIQHGAVAGPKASDMNKNSIQIEDKTSKSPSPAKNITKSFSGLASSWEKLKPRIAAVRSFNLVSPAKTAPPNAAIVGADAAIQALPALKKMSADEAFGPQADHLKEIVTALLSRPMSSDIKSTLLNFLNTLPIHRASYAVHKPRVDAHNELLGRITAVDKELADLENIGDKMNEELKGIEAREAELEAELGKLRCRRATLSKQQADDIVRAESVMANLAQLRSAEMNQKQDFEYSLPLIENAGMTWENFKVTVENIISSSSPPPPPPRKSGA